MVLLLEIAFALEALRAFASATESWRTNAPRSGRGARFPLARTRRSGGRAISGTAHAMQRSVKARAGVRLLVEGSLIKPFIDLSGEAIELRTAAFGRFLLGIEESNPQPRRPCISNL